MKESEFIAADNITYHLKGKEIVPNIEGAKEHKIKKGDKIPEILISQFLRRNRNYIANLPYKDGIPVLTKEQQKKYGVSFSLPKEAPFRKAVDKAYGQYTMEKLHQILAKKGAKEFKVWAEKKFGEDKIDRRKAAKAIVVDILDMQDGVKK